MQTHHVHAHVHMCMRPKMHNYGMAAGWPAFSVPCFAHMNTHQAPSWGTANILAWGAANLHADSVSYTFYVGYSALSLPCLACNAYPLTWHALWCARF